MRYCVVLYVRLPDRQSTEAYREKKRTAPFVSALLSASDFVLTFWIGSHSSEFKIQQVLFPPGSGIHVSTTVMWILI